MGLERSPCQSLPAGEADGDSVAADAAGEDPSRLAFGRSPMSWGAGPSCASCASPCLNFGGIDRPRAPACGLPCCTYSSSASDAGGPTLQRFLI